MSLRPVPNHGKPPLAAKPGKVSGEVHLVAKAVKGAKGNQWQYSTDGGKTWVDLPQTTKATTTLVSLTPGATVTFRHRTFSRVGTTDWGDLIAHVVT